MKKRQHKRPTNDGFSLIELIVTVLISACVVLTATGFLVFGLQRYQAMDEETSLQRESQLTELFLEELFLESEHFEEIGAEHIPLGSDIWKAVAVTVGGTEYLVVHSGTELWYTEATGITREEQILYAMTVPKSEKFLAKYVAAFDLIPGSVSDSSMAEGDGWFKIGMVFMTGERQYNSNTVIAFRNGRKN